MELVEVVEAMNTPKSLTVRVKEIAESIKKVPVQVEESAGFVVNRIFDSHDKAEGDFALCGRSVFCKRD